MIRKLRKPSQTKPEAKIESEPALILRLAKLLHELPPASEEGLGFAACFMAVQVDPTRDRSPSRLQIPQAFCILPMKPYDSPEAAGLRPKLERADDLGVQIASIRFGVLGFARHEGRRRQRVAYVGECSSPVKGPTKTLTIAAPLARRRHRQEMKDTRRKVSDFELKKKRW